MAQHRKDIPKIPYLRAAVSVALWDSIVASFAFLLLLPAIALWTSSYWPILAYIIDAPVVLVPVLIGGIKRRELGKALASFPSYFVLRLVNAVFVIEAFISEWLLQRRLSTYEKGH